MIRNATDYVVVHCSATPPDMDIGAATIDEWHRDRGWSSIGYHFVIRRNGRVELGRDIDAVGAHVKGYNSRSVGVCLVGGVNADMEPENNFTASQFRALGHLVPTLTAIYGYAINVVGHRDLDDSKDCPCFDVQGHFRGIT